MSAAFAGPSSVQAQAGSGIYTTETSPSILTPSSSQDSNPALHNQHYNSAPAPPVQPYSTGQTYLAYGNPAPYTGQWQSESQFQGPLRAPPPHSNFGNALPLFWNPLHDRRFTGGPRVNMPMNGPPEPLRKGGLFYNPHSSVTRDASYEIRPTSNGGPVNWQPWRQPPATEHGVEPGTDTCSNVAVACEGIKNQQGVGIIGPRMMDFKSEFERSTYLAGLGLPAGGDSPEARLFRALNMSHYILIDHMDNAQKEMKQYVCATVNKVVDHTQNSLGKKLHFLQKQVAELSKERAYTKPVEPRFTTLSAEAAQPAPCHPVDPEIEDNRSLQHLELAILKLWAHIDKIKDENHLRKEEKAERKELEELLAGELLHHNRTMEKMQAKINSMNREVTSCWNEIGKLKEAMEELDIAAFPQKLLAVKPTAAKSCVRDDPKIVVTPTGVVADPQELLQKINEELENLDARHKRSGGRDDECSCELCGKARAGKSAGVSVGGGHDSCSTEEEDIKGKGREKAVEEASTHLRVAGYKTTVGEYLAASSLTALDHAVITNVTPSSPILQKWRDVYNRSIQGKQRVLELMLPNGDFLILLVQPNEGAQKPARRGYGLSEDEPDSPAVDPSDINSLEIISPPGPHPLHAMPDNPLGKKASTVPSSNIKLLQLQTQSTDPAAPKPCVNAQPQRFAPSPQRAKNSPSGEFPSPFKRPPRMQQQPLAWADQPLKFTEGAWLCEASVEAQNGWVGKKPMGKPMEVAEGPSEDGPPMHRQYEVEAGDKDVIQRFERPEIEPSGIHTLIDKVLSKIKSYEATIKELKARAAMAEPAFHSGGGMHLTAAPRLYIQADTNPKPTSSPAQQHRRRGVEVEEVEDEADLQGEYGSKEGSSVDEKLG